LAVGHVGIGDIERQLEVVAKVRVVVGGVASDCVREHVDDVRARLRDAAKQQDVGAVARRPRLRRGVAQRQRHLVVDALLHRYAIDAKVTYSRARESRDATLVQLGYQSSQDRRETGTPNLTA
jgi:hypothetical protein